MTSILIRSAAVGVLALFLAAGAARADTPEQAVRALAEDFFAALADVALSDEHSPEEQRALVERRIQASLDFAGLTARGLGPLREQFTRDQLADFAHEYGVFIAFHLMKRVALFADRPGDITDLKYDAERDRVTLRVLGSERVPVLPGTMRQERRTPRRVTWDLLLHQRQGDWRITDFTVNAVNVSQNFRSQFDAVLRRSDPDALIAELRSRNRANEQENPFAG